MIRREKRPTLHRSRIFDRRDLDLRVKVHVSRNGRPRTIYGRTRDLSFGGMGVMLTEAVDAGSVAVVVFQIPAPRDIAQKTPAIEVRVTAVVTHRRGFHCGLEFVQLSGEQKLLIQKLCKLLP